MSHPCIYKDENVELFVEISEGDPFIHCTVYNWNHNLYKDFIKIWEEVINTFKKKGYSNIYASDMDEKITKFAKMFGFKETDLYTIGEDGKKRSVLCLVQ